MLEQTYDNKADIPTGYEHLYSEAEGKFTLLAGSQLKTAADVTTLQDGNRKERQAHDETKKTLAAYTKLGTVEELQTTLDSVDELKLAADGKIDETKLTEMVDARVKREKAPLVRDLEAANTALAEQQSLVGTLQGEADRRMIHDHIRKHAGDSLNVGGINDALAIGEQQFEVRTEGDTKQVVTKDGLTGVSPGVGADIWLAEMRENHQRDNWFKESKGAGSKGGTGGPGPSENPWTAANWNETKQADIISSNPEKAERFAGMAGTTVDGPKPAAQPAA